MKIVEIGKKLKKPEGALEIDCTDKYIIPGLADMHVHIERFENELDLRLFPLFGVTTIRNMDGRKNILEWKLHAKNNKIFSPRIYTAGVILEGNSPHWDDTQVVSNNEEATIAVSSQINEGYDFIKVYHTLGKEAFYTVINHAKEQNMYVSGHVPNEVGILNVLNSGQKCIEHFDGYIEEIEADNSPYKDKWSWLKMYSAVPIDQSKVEVVIQNTIKNNVWNCPTLIQKEKIAPYETVLKWYDSEQMNMMPHYLLKAWSPENFSHLKHLEDSDLEFLEIGRKNRLSFFKQLYDENGLILAGTDTPNPYVIPGYSLIEELNLFVEAGLSPYQALKIATHDAALFSNSNDWGSLENGKKAEMVILDANPLENIKNLEKIHGVIVNGLWIDEVSRKEMLAEFMVDKRN